MPDHRSYGDSVTERGLSVSLHTHEIRLLAGQHVSVTVRGAP
jgi:hypothetical protein